MIARAGPATAASLIISPRCQRWWWRNHAQPPATRISDGRREEHIASSFLLTGRASMAMAYSSNGGVRVCGNAHPVPSSYTTLKERVTCAREIKKSKFVAIAAHVTDEHAAHSFLSQVQDPRATHNCWAYKLGEHYRCNDDGEPSGTAGKPIYYAICSSGLDMVMVIVIRHFGGIKLGPGGLVRAYGGITSECLKVATTCFIKSKIPVGLEVPFDLLGSVYHQLRSFNVEDIKLDYDTRKDGFAMVTFRVDYDKVESLETAITTNCSREIVLYKH